MPSTELSTGRMWGCCYMQADTKSPSATRKSLQVLWERPQVEDVETPPVHRGIGKGDDLWKVWVPSTSETDGRTWNMDQKIRWWRPKTGRCRDNRDETLRCSALAKMVESDGDKSLLVLGTGKDGWEEHKALTVTVWWSSSLTVTWSSYCWAPF